MPEFRCNMLDERGHMLFPAHINADDLEAATRHAYDILRRSNQSSSLRYVYSFEIWSGRDRLFPPASNGKSAIGFGEEGPDVATAEPSD
jgi:hypothetical protein